MKYQKTFLSFLLLLSFSSAFANQTIESEGQTLALSEATICISSSVTMQIPQVTTVDNYVWLKNNKSVGKGASLTIENFQLENAGEYILVQTLIDGTKAETSFILNAVDLGDDLSFCMPDIVEFELAEGPIYNWSNGAQSNSFKVSFQESAVISVTAITEFGCTVVDELSITVSNLESDISVNPLEVDGSYCQSAIQINVTADEEAFPVLVFATFEGEESLIAQVNFSSTETFVKSIGEYTNVYACEINGCINQMVNFAVENQGPFFAGP